MLCSHHAIFPFVVSVCCPGACFYQRCSCRLCRFSNLLSRRLLSKTCAFYTSLSFFFESGRLFAHWSERSGSGSDGPCETFWRMHHAERVASLCACTCFLVYSSTCSIVSLTISEHNYSALRLLRFSAYDLIHRTELVVFGFFRLSHVQYQYQATSFGALATGSTISTDFVMNLIVHFEHL